MTAPADQPRPEPLVVVGCADTASGRAALLFAAQEARARSAGLRVVLAYQPSTDPDGDYFDMNPDREREHYRQIVEQLCEPLTRPGQTTPTADVVIGQGSAATVLLDACQDASMVVVGSGSHGFLARLTQTSTAARVLSEAQLPVVVVPAPPDGPSESSRA